MSISFGDLDVEIVDFSSSKIATPLLEVDSGFEIFIVRFGIVFYQLSVECSIDRMIMFYV